MDTTTNNNNKRLNEMIEEIALVKRVGRGYADVLPEFSSGCSSCSSKSGCSNTFSSLFNLFSLKKAEPQTIRVYNPVYAKPGDRVVIGLKPETLLKGTLLAYFVPLLILLVSAIIGGELFSLFGLNQETGSILLGVAGLLAGFKGVAIWMQTTLTSDTFQATILRLLTSDTQVVSFNLNNTMGNL